MVQPIGAILVQQGVFSQNQLHEYTTHAQEQNLSLIAYLHQEHLVTEQQIAQAYAQQLSIPYLETFNDEMADPVLLGKASFKFLRENAIIPLKINGKTTLVTANPTNFQTINELNVLLGESTRTAVAPTSIIIAGLNKYYPLEGTKQMIEELGQEAGMAEEVLEFGEIEEKDIMGMAQEAPIIKLVNQIIFQAVKREASDIHITPFEKEINVRYRIDGVMYPAFSPPKRIQSALISRIKIMANLNIAERRVPQDGRIQIKVADKMYDIRVSVLPASEGENIVMRLLDKTKTFGDLEQLGLAAHDYSTLMRAISSPTGIILMSGPTGSGKTSTLYSILSRLNSSEVNIITVENPVEYQMNGIVQVQVNEKVGLTFASALRSILRQDPDIIMIGETRDTETAQIATQASLTGHLVLTTIHTNNAPSTITRLIDMGIEPFLIASSVTCVIAQRLVRKLCTACRAVYNPNPELLKRIGLSPANAAGITFYQATGCSECSSTGYRGRIAIFEVMPMTHEIARLTVEKADTTRIEQAALKAGMHLLVQDGVEKIKQGLTTIDEVLAVATSAQDQPE